MRLSGVAAARGFGGYGSNTSKDLCSCCYAWWVMVLSTEAASGPSKVVCPRYCLHWSRMSVRWALRPTHLLLTASPNPNLF
jgi:hypothetical protein